MTDAEASRQIDQACLARLRDQVGDQLDIVLRQFLCMVPTSSGRVSANGKLSREWGSRLWLQGV
jgi:hypothetical protein